MNVENKFKVSIVVPIYNIEKYLEKCLSSIKSQTYENIEVILVNDGSTDNSEEICILYSNNDSRFSYYKKENGGLSDARNYGLRYVTGEYLIFVDSDDYLEIDAIEKMIKSINDNDLLIFNYKKVDENGDILSVSEFPACQIEINNYIDQSKFYFKDFFAYRYGWEAWNRMYKVDIIKKYNLQFYDNKKIFAEDIEFNFRYIIYSKSIIVTDEYIYNYLFRSDSLMANSLSIDKLNCFNELSKQLFRFLDANKHKFLLEHFYLIHCLIYFNFYQKLEKKNNIYFYIKNIEDKEFFWQNINKCLRNKNATLHFFTRNQYIKVLLTRFRLLILIDLFENVKKHRLINRYKSKNSNDIFLIGTEDFGNIGDHHIAKSEIDILKNKYRDSRIIEIPASKFYGVKPYLKSIIKDNKIYLTGGGNMGSLYLLSENIRLDIIKAFPNNRIVFFPVTIFYNNKAKLEYAQSVINKKKNLDILCRENNSYQFAKKTFTCNIYLTPDIVMTSHYPNEFKRNKVLLCLRSDKEKNLDNEEIKKIESILKKEQLEFEYYDTQLDHNISVKNRDKVIEDCINNFSSSELVITDRLHGMIFSLITNTPCIVYKNFNHKIEGVYEWLKDDKSIVLMNKGSIDEEIIEEMLSSRPNSHKTDYFIDIIKEII